MSYIDEVKARAYQGDPFAMFELACLYQSEALPSSPGTYIIWLRKFLDNPYVEDVIESFGHDGNDGSSVEDRFSESEYPHAITPIPVSLELIEPIVEACISIALYYRKSSNYDDLEYALICLGNAWALTKRDTAYTIASDEGVKISILPLINEYQARMDQIGGGVNA